MITNTISIDKIDGMKVEELKKILDQVPHPEIALVRISTHKGDRNEMDYHSLSVSWKVY